MHSFCGPIKGIPYLGMFLTDLVHAHASSATSSTADGAASAELKSARIVAELLRFQKSEYEIPSSPRAREYLESGNYSEELQKMIDEENYRLSLSIEPKMMMPRHLSNDDSGPVASDSGADGPAAGMEESTYRRVT